MQLGMQVKLKINLKRPAQERCTLESQPEICCILQFYFELYRVRHLTFLSTSAYFVNTNT